MYRYLRSAVPWRPLVASGTLAVPLLAAGAWWADAVVGHYLLQFGLALLGAAAAYSHDEPAAAAVDATPTSLPSRTTRRLLVLVPLATAWTLAVAAGAWRAPAIPVAVLLAEGAGVLTVAVAAGVALRRAGRARPGETVAGPVALAVVTMGAVGLPARWTSALPVAPEWQTTSALWVLVGSIAVVALLAAPDEGRTWARLRPVITHPVRRPGPGPPPRPGW